MRCRFPPLVLLGALGVLAVFSTLKRGGEGEMSLVGDAIRAYHALLDDDTARETQALLDEGQRREGLFFGQRALATVLRPHFITDEHEALLREACQAVAVAARQVMEYVLKKPALLRRMGFPPRQR